MTASTSSSITRLQPDPWTRTAAAVAADLFALGLFALVLWLVRIGMVVALRDHLAESTDGWALMRALARGARFDLQMATVTFLTVMAVSLTTAWHGHERLRHVWRRTVWTLAITSTAMLGVVDVYYFREFGNQFDHYLLEPLQEDLHALMLTIWQSYPVVTVGVIALALVAAVGWTSRWTLIGEGRMRSWVAPLGNRWRLALTMAALVGIACAARGSVWHRPLQMGTSSVTRDRTLNKLIPTPWHCIRAAIIRHRELAQDEMGSAHLISDGDLHAAARRRFGAAGNDLDQAVQRVARGQTGVVPRHIILVLLEGQSGWPLFPRYQALGLAPELATLAQRGLIFTDFMSASNGTIYSLGPICSGIPDSGVVQSYAPATRRPLPTSLAPIFHRLGYRTRFVYGGFLASKRYGDFVRDQGFDEVHGQNEIITGRRNAWGVDDQELFKNVDRLLDDHEPTFTLVLTTSNHPPYEVDLAAAGFNQAAFSAAAGQQLTAQADPRALGHLWYNDHCVGAFVRTIQARLPRLLVAITGDHYGRKFINSTPTVAERSAVPLVLYGPEVLKDRTVPAGATGGHLDLIPTLVELSAPAGFAYHAWGHDLLTPGPGVGSGAGILVSGGQWLDFSQPAMAQAADEAAYATWKIWYGDNHGLAWWRLTHGPRLP